MVLVPLSEEAQGSPSPASPCEATVTKWPAANQGGCMEPVQPLHPSASCIKITVSHGTLQS